MQYRNVGWAIRFDALGWAAITAIEQRVCGRCGVARQRFRSAHEIARGVASIVIVLGCVGVVGVFESIRAKNLFSFLQRKNLP
jgi:hypothetical protein